MKRKLFSVFLLSLLILSSCKKEAENLFGISIDTNKMVNSPAEVFSLQQIKMFALSNDFILQNIRQVYPNTDTSKENFAVAPFHLLFTLAKDTSFNSYLSFLESNHNIPDMTSDKRAKLFKDFLSSVNNIDSSIHIDSDISSYGDDSCVIQQSFCVDLHTEETASSFGEAFGSTMINISGEFPFFEDNGQIISEIPLGNGNYVLSLFKPKNKNLSNYIQDFNEEKYASLLKNTELRKYTLAIPLFNIDLKEKELNFISNNDDLSNPIQKKVFLNTEFRLENHPLQSSSFEERMKSANNSKPIVFDGDFIFILRGKNSNLIMFIGILSENIL
ncbi:MAG: hypothetical protein IJ748_01290 [Bacteroidales bacterium]|nr:hypothetical protein [Bacteroidales bacterium]